MSASPIPRRVLLIAPRFFGYEQEIAKELIRTGYLVDTLPDRPFNSPLMKAVMRFRPEIGGYRACERFFSNQLEKLGRSDYEIILIVQGEGVTGNTIVGLRKAYPKARLVFHTWDSIENKPFSTRNLRFYDTCSTFDQVDAKKYGMFFRPLFYSDGFDQPPEIEFEYDLSFIGTVHSDRYRIVHTLLKKLPPETQTFVYLYLQAPWMYDLRRMFTTTIDGAKPEDFGYEPLTKELVQTTFFRSRAILDIEHINQRGATMRTMEALGSKRKLVTTNANLRDYDFYNPINIQIIDRKVPCLNHEFLQTPYQPLPEEIRQKYSIRTWIREVCGMGDFEKQLHS